MAISTLPQVAENVYRSTPHDGGPWDSEWRNVSQLQIQKTTNMFSQNKYRINSANVQEVPCNEERKKATLHFPFLPQVVISPLLQTGCKRFEDVGNVSISSLRS